MKPKFQLFLLTLFSFFVLLSSDVHKQSIAGWFGNYLAFPFTSPIKYLKSMDNLLAKNQRLQAENQNLLTENLAYRDQKLLLEKNDLQKRGMQLAIVIGILGDYNQRSLLLDVGSNQAVELDAPVITSQGVVGKVIGVQRNAAEVLPVGNAKFRLSVKSKRARIQGVLTTSLDGTVFVDMIDFGADVRKGDLFISSNLSSIFPEGFKVGTVQYLRSSDYGNRLQAVLEPMVDVANLEAVYILKAKK